MSPMRWHPAYSDNVLMPDYRFASQHLAQHFLDALSAHVRTVKRLPEDAITRHQGDISRLEAAISRLRREPLPLYDAGVPDLYFAFNTKLEAELGENTVGFMRLGLSRNDLDMTVYKMRARESLLNLATQLCTLRSAILKQAQGHLETILIAYTHHQPGQPTSVAHYLAAVDNALARDLERLFEAYTRLNLSPLGAAALAGSSHPLDRAYTAELLGFDGPVTNTYDAVASSDWQVEIVGVAQSSSLTLSRFVCDLLAWSSQNLFVLPESLVQGSSIMPQKRNPVALEHARTRFSRALGGAQAVLYSSHNIPYGDLNDFGPDIQGALATLSIQLSGGLALLTACVDEGYFNERVLERLAATTDTTATELADELARYYGLSFQEAHRLVARLVARAHERGETLREVTPEDIVALGGPPLTAAALDEALDPRAFIRRRNGLGGPAPEVVAEHVRAAQAQLHESISRTEQLQSVLGAARERLHAPGKESHA